MSVHAALAEGGTPVMGAEREYRAHLVAHPGRPRWDPRPVWDVIVSGVHLDPSDPNARRGSWGGVLTLDGLDPEIVTAPAALRLGCINRLHDTLVHGQEALSQDLGAAGVDVDLSGYSTHVSIEVPDDRVVAVARQVLARHAPALMLAFDRVDSPGILVRPRPGRLEICGEFTAGRQFRTAAALSLGVALLADRTVRRPWTGRSAARVRGSLVPAVERYGWYVDREAFGSDLYRDGRTARLRGRWTSQALRTAQDALHRTWSLARPLAEPLLTIGGLHEVDRLVDGHDPIPCELPVLDDDTPVIQAPRHSYAARDLGEGIRLEVEAATWYRAVLRVDLPEGSRWVTVPGRSLDALLTAIDTRSGVPELIDLCRAPHRPAA